MAQKVDTEQEKLVADVKALYTKVEGTPQKEIVLTTVQSMLQAAENCPAMCINFEKCWTIWRDTATFVKELCCIVSNSSKKLEDCARDLRSGLNFSVEDPGLEPAAAIVPNNNHNLHTKSDVSPPHVLQSQNEIPGQNKSNHNSALGKSSTRPYGLKNLGNTCYLNSTLQCLTHTTPLREYLIGSEQCHSVKGKFEKEINQESAAKGEFIRTYAQFVKKMWSSTSNESELKKLKREIAKVDDRFGRGSQEDAQEVLVLLLQKLHEEVNDPTTTEYVDMDDIITLNRSDEMIAAEYWDKFSLRDKSIIVDLFYSQVKNETSCPTCNSVELTFQPALGLILPIPLISMGYASAITLSDCLDLFVQEKETEETCGSCDVRKYVKKKLWRLPQILIIYLKRFSWTSGTIRKNTTKIKCDLQLDLMKYTAQQNCCYQLYGITSHQGHNTKSGHYVAHVQYDNEWYYCSDTTVLKATEAEVKKNDGFQEYILFYEQVQN